MIDTSKPRGESRVALVTGAAVGVGAAIAERLSRRGLRVAGVDIKPIPAGLCAQNIQADLADPASCDRIVAEVGAVDVLVNNAGVLSRRSIHEVTLDDFDLSVAINLRSAFFLSQALVKGMSERGWGRIINISTVGARTGGLNRSAVYNATKAAMISLTKSFARDYGPMGVTVNAVAPGAIETAMVGDLSAGRKERYLKDIPLRRFGESDEVASVVEFLAGEDAAYITGATIDVNGGWLMT